MTTCGVIQTANSPSILHTIGSRISTSGFVLVLVLLWKRAIRPRLYLLSELLPRGWELGVLVFLLATQYIGLGLRLRPEKLPGIVPPGEHLGLLRCFLFAACAVLEAAGGPGGCGGTGVPDTVALETMAAVCDGVLPHFDCLPAVGGVSENPDIRGPLGRRDRRRLGAARGLGAADLPSPANYVGALMTHRFAVPSPKLHGLPIPADQSLGIVGFPVFLTNRVTSPAM
jgi:hypothetical protein